VLAEHGGEAKLLAGGQSLLPALNMRLLAPRLLLDLGGIDALRGIAVADGIVSVGALTRHVELQRSAEVACHLPLLAQAVQHIAHPAVRNRGTIGGSIANADPAAEMPACAVALAARMVIAGPTGTRIVAAADFFRGLYETALAPAEILTALEFDAIRPGERSGFAELARRRGDYALVGLAAHATLRDERLAELRLVYFSVGPIPVQAKAAASCLIDGAPNAATLAAAQAALAADLDPPEDAQATRALRLHLARILLGRVTAELVPIAAAAPARRS